MSALGCARGHAVRLADRSWLCEEAVFSALSAVKEVEGHDMPYEAMELRRVARNGKKNTHG